MDELTLDSTGGAIPRDMSTVMGAMAGSRIERKAPPDEVLPNFDVRKVTAGKEVYHGRGWLPPPYTFSVRWVVRRLEPKDF